eukprot:6213890-Pleurochrysis_carterae.AAC.2
MGAAASNGERWSRVGWRSVCNVGRGVARSASVSAVALTCVRCASASARACWAAMSRARINASMAGRGRVMHTVGAAFDDREAGTRLAAEGLTRVYGSMYG